MPLYQWICSECSKSVDVIRTFDDSDMGPSVDEVKDALKSRSTDDCQDGSTCTAVGGHHFRKHIGKPLVQVGMAWALKPGGKGRP